MGGSFVLALLGACLPAVPDPNGRILGLSTSLPLIWSSDGDIRGELSAQASPHWSGAVLAKYGRIVLLDTLLGADEQLPLPQDGLLVLVQPRPLTPAENVALDAWVRDGGRVLLFADPMLTTSSHLPFGDPRGPQWAIMLSPILNHWGLHLSFDPAQLPQERVVRFAGEQVPTNLSGRFAILQNAPCEIKVEGLVAECRIGKGLVLAVADAALFDGDGRGKSAALDALLSQISR